MGVRRTLLPLQDIRQATPSELGIRGRRRTAHVWAKDATCEQDECSASPAMQVIRSVMHTVCEKSRFFLQERKQDATGFRSSPHDLVHAKAGQSRIDHFRIPQPRIAAMARQYGDAVSWSLNGESLSAILLRSAPKVKTASVRHGAARRAGPIQLAGAE